MSAFYNWFKFMLFNNSYNIKIALMTHPNEEAAVRF
jgi:hypothetical protein